MLRNGDKFNRTSINESNIPAGTIILITRCKYGSITEDDLYIIVQDETLCGVNLKTGSDNWRNRDFKVFDFEIIRLPENYKYKDKQK